MEEKFVKFYKCEIKSVDDTEKTVTALVSSKKVDRDGDVIMPEAFTKGLKNYKAHPVLLSSHDYKKLTNQIGIAEKLTVTDEGLEAKFKYLTNLNNPEADWAFILAQKGMASYSIGFLGRQFDWIKEKDAEGQERITGRKFTDIELLEISQVCVPSNPHALQREIDALREDIEVRELVMKSIDKGELNEQEKTLQVKDLASEPKPVVEAEIPAPDNKEKHYSDVILGAEAQAISAPLEKELDIVDIKEAIKTAVNQKE